MQINLDVDVIRDLLVMRGWEVRLEGGGFRYVRPEAYGRDAHNLKPVEDFLWHADEALQQCLQGEAASGQHTVGLNGRTVAVKVDLAFDGDEPELLLTPDDGTRLEGEMPGMYMLVEA